MRIIIDINEDLIRQAQDLSKAKTEKEVVELALHYFIESLRRKQLLNLRVKVTWEGNLEKRRSTRHHSLHSSVAFFRILTL